MNKNKQQVSGTEINGPATILMMLDAMVNNPGSCIQNGVEVDQIKKLAQRTIDYIKQLDNPNKVNWSDV